MLSTEKLRYYPFFGLLNSHQLQEISMIADEEAFEGDEIIFQEGQPAEALYLLLEGSVDLYFTIAGAKPSRVHKGIPVGEINPGETFAISALIEPNIFTATARASSPSRVVKIDAAALKALFEKDRRMAYLFTNQAAKAALERLHATRVQLAAAWV
jgi:CRP-like cAMP-binding protein